MWFFSLYADTADFDATIFNITFPADENEVAILSVPASIPVVDDDVNEAVQFFIAFLELLDAPNAEQIVGDQQDFSTCSIIDNDGMC